MSFEEIVLGYTIMDGKLLAKHVALPIMSVLMVVGNAMLIFVTLKHKHLRTVTAYFIMSLAFTDLLMGCIVVPIMVAAEEGVFGRSPMVCLTVFCLAIGEVLVSCLMLLTIALERYISIVCPLKHHSLLGKRNALIIIAMCWVYGLTVGFLPLLGWNSIGAFNERSLKRLVESDIPTCMKQNSSTYGHLVNISERISPFRCLYQNVISGSYAGFMYPGHFVVMWCIMLILYGHIYLKTRNRHNNNDVQAGVRRLSFSLLGNEVGSKKHAKRVKENWKAIKILAVIVGYFIISWVGMLIWYGALYRGFTLDSVPDGEPPLPYWFYNVAIILAFGNSVLNPFIYGLGHRSVRKAFMATLYCKPPHLKRQLSQRSLTSQRNAPSSSSNKDLIVLTTINKSAGKIVDV